ncbi:family 2 glycoside hydrolase [Truncatella angustata]|uniref:Family 2 glycoside hydrolase n=1 Tax=Truncatella angustata TaxID=152316 RepID=A0A9P8UZ32_9PEZI|nr:family 2 glycoside hydrolase [Truncatella angustata]KAH6660636.1 family 2 glycoside hydrolase [Truncatella angustata]
MQMHFGFGMLSAGLQSALVAATGYHSRHAGVPGRSQLISQWDVQSIAAVKTDSIELSLPGADVSSWHHVNASRCTLMGCLLEAGVYDESQLFYSDNLKQFDRGQFSVPWLYRYEFSLSPTEGQHYFLETNGITSKADLYLNGHQVANQTTQVGAYAGHTYDVTGTVLKNNALVVQVYPTDYNYDFALGFVDWNPYPPDNGTGVWRDIFIKRTGSVGLTSLRTTTDFELPHADGSASITVIATVRNLEDRDVIIEAESAIARIGSYDVLTKTHVGSLKALGSMELSLTTVVHNAAIWWPKAWGKQPLYSAQLSITVDGTVSDSTSTTFGIRKVTSELNSNNDTVFRVNGHPFQVLGGGYSADMFLRWDSAKFTTQAQYMLDLGHNTVRLEGKNEHPELYAIADRMGLMVLPGWECCDKWEAWAYNEDLAVKDEWSDSDYDTADVSIRHEVAMLQSHPSVLGYLVGSDYWPDDRAASIYLQAFKDSNWQNPIIASASKRGYPSQLGPSGMKMAGPYDWVPPNYWYDTDSNEDRLGAASGFGSELSAGVGTPELGSLKKFLTSEDMDALWQNPDEGLYHMSTNVSSFYNRKIYNEALWNRLGAPQSLDDYLLKAQILDYEATRAQFEGFSAYWNAERPATGMIYWMLNNAWPSLHWNLFDYYLHPAGSYFGAKVGSRQEHVAYNYAHKSVYLINHSIDVVGARFVVIKAIGLDGTVINSTTLDVQTWPNTSRRIHDLSYLSYPTDVIFLQFILMDVKHNIISRNVYWLAKTLDTLDWENSDWFYTPVNEYANYSALESLREANVVVSANTLPHGDTTKVVLENKSDGLAFFISLNLVDDAGQDVLPVFWSDNYVSLWPHETLELEVETFGSKAKTLQIRGYNVAKSIVSIHHM